ncbi:MAG: c-type cytochrome [Sterolibacterium sp.]
MKKRMKKLEILAVGVALFLSGTQLGIAADGKEIFESTCSACHKRGMLGAPKLGDKDRWTELAKTGKDALVESAFNGKGRMPAQSRTREEIMAAVEFMLKAAE